MTSVSQPSVYSENCSRNLVLRSSTDVYLFISRSFIISVTPTILQIPTSNLSLVVQKSGRGPGTVHHESSENSPKNQIEKAMFHVCDQSATHFV